MNTERLKAIIATIKAQPETWKQTSWHFNRSKEHPCGTAHCIAGFAELAYLGSDKPTSPREMMCAEGNAMRWLELDQDQAHYLFSPIRTLPEIEKFAETEGYIPYIVDVHADDDGFLTYTCAMPDGDTYKFNSLAECGEIWQAEAKRLREWEYADCTVEIVPEGENFEGHECLIYEE